jgi:threonine/homoserine/homoserine lactone efflux protein
VGLLAIFAMNLGVSFTGAVMPGPVLMVMVARVAARGFRVAPRVVLGHAILELGLVLALALGLQPVLQRQGLQGAIGLVGGAVLLWMGLSVLVAAARGRMRLDLKGGSPLAEGGSARDVILGATTSATNPYWLIWWATAGAALILPALSKGAVGLAAAYLGHISGDLVWYTAVGALIAAGRSSIKEHHYRNLIVSCALFLVALALWFVVSGALLLSAGP